MYLTIDVNLMGRSVMELNLNTEQYGKTKGRMLLEDNIGYELNDDEVEWMDFEIEQQKGSVLIYDDVIVHWFNRPITDQDMDVINDQLMATL